MICRYTVSIALALFSCHRADATAVTLYEFDLNTDPGWTITGDWSFGVPAGLGGSNGSPDPTSGATDSNVFGYNLIGDYTHTMEPETLTTTALDFSDATGVTLQFDRWLGVEESSFDNASVEVSNDGLTWTEVWSNREAVNDGTWLTQSYNISTVADGQSTVFIRWVMGATDESLAYCGWNIDDIKIHAFVDLPGSTVSFNMDIDPGWTLTADWGFGVPEGCCSAGRGLDPTSGVTGSNVYGYNLAGDYANSMGQETLTTTALDFSDATGVTLSFARWLCVERNSFDHASIEVSNDGSTWAVVWSNPDITLNGGDWEPQLFDISAVADGQSTVFVRWVMGASDGSVPYCGWNIDDVVFTFDVSLDAFLSIDLPDQAVSAGSSIQRVSVSNLGEGVVIWNLSESCEWVTPSHTDGLGGGTIELALTDNPSTEARSCTLNFTSNGGNETAVLTQAGAPPGSPSLNLAQPDLCLEKDAGSASIEIANSGEGLLNWSAAVSCNWMKLTTKRGSQGASESESIVVIFESNPHDNVTRICDVSIETNSGQETIRFTQRNNLDGSGCAEDFEGVGGGGCFIATAAYGTPMAQEIDVLRELRNTHLQPTVLGAVFVDSYYRLSPPIADLVARNSWLRTTVRTALTPIIFSTNMIASIGTSQVAGFGILSMIYVFFRRKRLKIR
ncbi:BACON domain-containing protein [bacterium AH-315-P07]|nr:BACON domain-containing protein [bacterium AH-315-P07]